MGNAVIKIVREAKRIRKAHPRKYAKRKNSWLAYMQEASNRYNRGAIGKPKKKSAAKKRRRVPKKRVGKKAKHRRVATVHSVSGVRRKRAAPRRKRASYRVTHTVRRVGRTGGSDMKNLLMIGALGLGAYLLFKGSKTTTQTAANSVYPSAPPLNLTGNTSRDSQAQNIIAWATAGGMAVDSIIKLINSLNNKSDAQVSEIHNDINSGAGVPDWAFIA